MVSIENRRIFRRLRMGQPVAAFAVVLVGICLGLGPASAEGSRNERPAVAVDPDARLPAVKALERFLKQNLGARLHGATEPAAPPPPAQPKRTHAAGEDRDVVNAMRNAAVPPRGPARESGAARTVEAPAIIEEDSGFQPAPTAARTKGLPADETIQPPMNTQSLLVTGKSNDGLLRRILSSKEFLWFAGISFVLLPLILMTWSAIISRRREERDLMLYD